MTKNPWEPLYHKLKEEAPNVQRCCVCRTLGAKSGMDPHHINGRLGVLVLDFKWAHKACHRWIHDNPEMAKKRGLYHTLTPIELRHHVKHLEEKHQHHLTGGTDHAE